MKSEAERFWEKVNKNGPLVFGYEELGPCFLWTAYKSSEGYGQFAKTRVNGSKSVTIRVHRWIWIETHGEIPIDLEPDHLCHTYSNCTLGNNCLHRSCVNINHLKLVTHAENVSRGNSGINSSVKTQCPEGHEYSEENTGHTKSGNSLLRYCKTCKTVRSVEYQKQNREQVLAKGRERERLRRIENLAEIREKERLRSHERRESVRVEKRLVVPEGILEDLFS